MEFSEAGITVYESKIQSELRYVMTDVPFEETTLTTADTHSSIIDLTSEQGQSMKTHGRFADLQRLHAPSLVPNSHPLRLL